MRHEASSCCMMSSGHDVVDLRVFSIIVRNYTSPNEHCTPEGHATSVKPKPQTNSPKPKKSSPEVLKPINPEVKTQLRSVDQRVEITRTEPPVANASQ